MIQWCCQRASVAGRRAAGGLGAARRVLAAASFGCLIGSPLPAQEAPRGPEIEAVRFTGATSLETTLLAQAIASRPTTCRTPLVTLFCLIGDFGWAEVKQFLPDTAQVAEDAERLETLYEMWGFPDAAVTGAVLPQRDGDVVIEFTVNEGRPIVIRSLEILGLDSLAPPATAPPMLPLRVGEPYALPRLESLIELLEDIAARRGHPYAQVEVAGEVDEPAFAADLRLQLQPGRAAVFGATTIETEAPIDEVAVRDRLAFRAGERFDPDAIQTTTRRLYDLPIVERAVIEPIGIMQGDTTIETRVLVEARRRTAIEAEGTISSVDCLALATFWRHRYFLGGPRVFALGVSLSNLLASQADGGFPCGSTGAGEFAELDHSIDAELWQPALFGDARYTLRLGGYKRRQSSPNAWIERGVGGRLGVSRDIGRGFHALLDYRLERNELEASGIYFCGNYGVCSGAGIGALAQPTRLAPLDAVLIWRSTDQPLDVRRTETGPGRAWNPVPVPDWRWNARLAFSGADDVTGSEYAFTRALLEAGGTRVLGRSAEFAARLRLGWLGGDDVLPPQIRIFSGGAATVRGAEQNLLGPRVLVSTTDEGMEVCDDAAAGCTLPPVDPGLVTLRPTGGDRVIEANLEARYWLTSSFQLAAFIDYGRVSGDIRGLAGAGVGDAARQALLAPGVGFRLITDLGPIRVDVGYDPSGPRMLPLLVDDDAGGIRHAGFVRFDPFEWDDPGLFRAFTRRLQVHMAIGQAF
jgi:outer membrane protein assembly factor BamA